MSKTFDDGRKEIASLCHYFATNRAAFHAPGVKEAHVRQSLIDPFFEALGGDVRNAARAAPQYREVVPEDSLDVEGEQKSPDYTSVLEKGGKPKRVTVNEVTTPEPCHLSEYVVEHRFTIPHQRLSAESWALKSDAEAAVFAKIMKAGRRLGEYVEGRFFRGVTSGLNEAFIVDAAARRKLLAKDKRSADLSYPLLAGQDIRRYVFHDPGQWIIFTRRGVDIDRYPAIRAHLSRWRDDLAPKRHPNAKRGGKPGRYAWYEIQDDVAYWEVFHRPKTIFPDITKEPRFCLDTSGHYLTNTAYCLGTDERYLLGLLNSRLFWFAISNISIPFGIRAGRFRYRLIYQYMEQVPIRVLDPSNAKDRNAGDQIIQLVEQLQARHPQEATAKLPAHRELLQRQIAAADAQIDQLVYPLYGLTGAEIKLVESAVND